MMPDVLQVFFLSSIFGKTPDGNFLHTAPLEPKQTQEGTLMKESPTELLFHHLSFWVGFHNLHASSSTEEMSIV